MSLKVIKSLIPFLSILSHGVSYFQFKFLETDGNLPLRWNGQLLFLLIISLMITVLLVFCHQAATKWCLFLTRGLILILITLPSGENVEVLLTLMIPQILEVGLYLNQLAGLVYNVVLTVIVIGLKKIPISAWGRIRSEPSLSELLFFAVYAVFMIIIGAYVNYQENNRISSLELNRRLNEATLKLVGANLQLQDYAVIAEKEAIDNERKRVAREIHDTLAYTLANLTMMLDAAIGLAVTANVGLVDHLTKMRTQVTNGLAETRRALQALRPVQLTEVKGLTAIKRLVNTFSQATNIAVDLNFGNAPPFFDEKIEWTIYRLIQEGMTNALRHGRATHIQISLSEVHDGLAIMIKDNGGGSTGVKEGYGLIGMRERIEKLGGKLQAIGQMSEGFALTAWIPLREGSER